MSKAINIKLISPPTMYQGIILPRPGKKFIFDIIPGGSYASVGEIYTASYGPNVHTSGDIYVSHEDSDGHSSGTYDRISAWGYAKWRYIDD